MRFRLYEHGLTLLTETLEKFLHHPGQETSHPQVGLEPELALATEPEMSICQGGKPTTAQPASLARWLP